MPAVEFALDPVDLPLLVRRGGMRAGRSYPAEISWHDTPDRALAARGLSLASTGAVWRLERLRQVTCIATAPPLAENRRLDLLGIDIPEGLARQARFTGRRRALRWTQGEITVGLQVMEGRFDSPVRRVVDPGLCRVILDGPAGALSPLAIGLAEDMGLRVSLTGLAEQALAAVSGQAPPPRSLGAPEIEEGKPVGDSLARIAGHLLDVMLYWASLVPAARSPEAVHQMRVATRRLRSALSVYKPVAGCPELAALSVTLKFCAARLGTARDWDVFIDGLGARLAAAFPDDPRCTAMLRAAARRRRNAYTELRGFLTGPDFRTMGVALACAATLRPWTATVPVEALEQDTAVFAATVLAKRMKRVRHAGRGLAALPVPALHELRKDCKRLRYAAEFFAPLFGAKKTRRFLQRLADLQEELGLLNDSAAVSGLMAQLGRLERSYAAGLVEGFSAAHAGEARDRIAHAWKGFRAAPLFWVR